MSGESPKPPSKRAKTKLRQSTSLSDVDSAAANLDRSSDASTLLPPPYDFSRLSASALNVIGSSPQPQPSPHASHEISGLEAQPSGALQPQPIGGPSSPADCSGGMSGALSTPMDWQIPVDLKAGLLDAVSTEVFKQVGGKPPFPPTNPVLDQIGKEMPSAFQPRNPLVDICPETFTPLNAVNGQPMDFERFFQHNLFKENDTSQDISNPVLIEPPTEQVNFAGTKQDQGTGNLPLYEGSPHTVNDCMVSILSYAQSAHLSASSTAELLNLFEMFLPKPNNLLKTSHMFKKYFEDDSTEIQVFFFCSNCWRSRDSEKDICTECRGPNRKVNYFISCSLESQLQRLYSRPGFSEKLKYKYSRTKRVEENIEDIYDGSVYKNAEKTILGNGKNISLTWYSDGIQIYECSTYSVWLVMYVINELPPEDRHKPENVLMGGLWGGDGKPHPNIFLAPMYCQIKKLNEGISVKKCGSDEEEVVCAFILCGTCDVPAKADFMNMKSHSGYFSCTKCFIKGEKSERTGNVTVFPHQSVLELRNDENYRLCVEKGVSSKDGYMGVFGPSMLAYMFSSPFISGMTIDVMHAVYMGCTKQFLRAWFDVKFKGQPFSLYGKITTVNDRLRAFNLPHFVQRLLIDVDKSLSFWKASLCRNFLLYIVLVLLKDILPEKYYLNLCKFVEGISLLNSSSISESDLDKADKLLFAFCKEFETLYGLRHMSHNIHLVRHLKDCVVECGNLFYNSCFRFEDLNGKFAGLAHGTRHAIKQISSRMKLVTDLPLLINSVRSQTAQEYCLKLSRRSKNFKLTEKIGTTNSYVVGDLSDISVHMQTAKELFTALYGPLQRFRYFDRLYNNGQLYVSSSYEKGSRISSYCKYQCDGQTYHGLILTFLKSIGNNNNKYFVLLERSQDRPTHFERYVEFHNSESRDLVSVNELVSVSFCLAVENHKYLVDTLNSFEFE